jgi:hypothetical protein
LLGGKMISAEDFSLFRVTNKVEETVDELLRFYRVFDRMEYVDNRLVLRLRERIDDSQIAAYQRDFADILNDGTFRQELDSTSNGSPASAKHSKLIFHFNRRSLGRLRQLIDVINAVKN